MSIQLKVNYMDELPAKERPTTYSKYELEIRKFLLMKQKVAQIKMPSSKQAGTVTSSFRREIKKNGHIGLSVARRDKTVYLVKTDAGGEM